MTHTLTASTARPTAGRTRAVAIWTVQVLLAAQFAASGLLKVTGDAGMVAMFADIGAGQWLRYAVGGLELAAAVGLLVPALACLAALGLVGLMGGAAITNLFALHTTPAVPAALCLVSGAVAYGRRHELRSAIHTLSS